MEQIDIKYIHEFFEKLIEIYGFRIKTELNEEQYYMIEFCSKDFVFKIDQYFREFYATLYKIDTPNNEINLFNLLEYLKQGDSKVPTSEYFRKEKDIKQCFRKQFNHLSSVLYENYTLINDFFNDKNYELNVVEFEKYWKNKHPELYKKA